MFYKAVELNFMKQNLIKVIFLLIFFLLLASCKQSLKNDMQNSGEELSNQTHQNKQNPFERTKWKFSSSGAGSVDVVLDFYTNKKVAEYTFNSKGKQINKTEGTYKAKTAQYVRILWDLGKPVPVEVEGRVNKKVLTLTKGLEKEQYYKIEEY